MTATLKVAVILSRITGGFVLGAGMLTLPNKLAVQIIETHQNVVTPEWLGSAEPVTRLD
jgi:hypothetical protein